MTNNGNGSPPRPVPRGARQLVKVDRPTQAAAPTHTPLIAKAGNAAAGGMGLGMAVRSSAMSGLIQKAEQAALGQEIAPGCLPDPADGISCGNNAAAIAQGGALGPGVAPNIYDYQVYDGFIGFNRREGRHFIPLSCGVSAAGSPSVNSGVAGAINVPNGKVFIVTGFVPYAMINNVGLPGAYEPISPFALVGSVLFGLVTDTGVSLNMRTTITDGAKCSTTNGVSVLYTDIMQGSVPQSYMFPENVSIRAFYEVISPVYRCFPTVVGVDVSGYMTDAQLISEAVGDSSGGAYGPGCATGPVIVGGIRAGVRR
jgi:hypothetical protein